MVFLPRTKRKISPTGYYHIMIRGINKEAIFRCSKDKSFVYHLFTENFSANEIGLTAYCIMNNHIHFLLQGDLANISDSFRKINLRYAIRYNAVYQRVGHVFQNRYKSEVIDTSSYLLTALRYIHNNPVKAGYVLSPKDYAWSSYRHFIEEPGAASKKKKVAISKKEKEAIMQIFDHDPLAFRLFHKEEDFCIHLDTPEDVERIQKKQSDILINQYLVQHNVSSIAQIPKNSKDMACLIILLFEKMNLSTCKIVSLLNVQRSFVTYVKKHGISENA